MRLVTFSENGKGKPEIGVIAEDGVSVVALGRISPDMPRTMTAFIRSGADGLLAARAAMKNAFSGAVVPLSDVTLKAPIPIPPRNVLCIGKNYRDHANEVVGSFSTEDSPVPDHPIVFTKSVSTITGPGAPIEAASDPTDSIDYEGELAVVIGREGKKITAENAFAHVYGYTIINDLSSRRLQKRHDQWFLGKNLDGFCPMGPTLVTAEEIADVTALTLETRVNDEVRQQGAISDLIFDIPTLIETLSSVMTLLPGDIIATGTPSGVGMGFDPPRFLKAGDVVTISISGLGTLETPIV